jgi:hypothetical protein
MIATGNCKHCKLWPECATILGRQSGKELPGRIKRCLAPVLLIGFLWIAGARAAQRCDEPSSAGIKRCEEIVTSKVDPTINWKTITYTDSNKEIVDLAITFSRKMGEPIYADALVGSSMRILAPDLSQDDRRLLIVRLLQNADEKQSEFIPAGRYEWTSFKPRRTTLSGQA